MSTRRLEAIVSELAFESSERSEDGRITVEQAVLALLRADGAHAPVVPHDGRYVLDARDLADGAYLMLSCRACESAIAEWLNADALPLGNLVRAANAHDASEHDETARR